MDYVKGEDREQISLFTQTLDDIIDKKSSVRAIDIFVNSLDLKKLNFKNTVLNKTGRPPYEPSLFLKLYLYGYLNNIITLRKLEQEAKRNIELMWLLKKLTPDFRTIGYFLENNGENIKDIFREFLTICKQAKLIKGNLVAIDSGRFKAVNSKKNFYMKSNVEKSLKKYDEKIDEYLKKIKDSENEKESEIDEIANNRIDNLKEKVEKIIKNKEKLEKIKKEMDENDENQKAITDPDSKMMAKNGKYEICYNVQMTSESENKLLIDYKVTNEADRKSTSEMVIRAKEVLELENKNDEIVLEALFDRGYYEFIEIEKCLKEKVYPYIPHPKNNKNGEYSKENFTYDEKENVYICPEGKKLELSWNYINKKRKNRKIEVYNCKNSKDCKKRIECSTNKKGRTVERWENAKIIEKHAQKMKETKSKSIERSSLIEHVVGNVKYILNKGVFTYKRMKKVTAQFGLAAIAYNFKRVMNILGINGLINTINPENV